MSEKFDYIKVGIASPERILSWSRGEVTKPETINYRTLKPERDGLFCERIFGPAKDWECHCGKYKRVRHKGIICERCGVEVTDSKVRRYRMGHIKLAAPVAHIWYLKGIPSYLSLLLDIPLRSLEDVVYFNAYIVLDPGNTNLEKRQTITEDDFETLDANEEAHFVAKMGADAVKELLAEMDMLKLGEDLKAEINSTTGQKRAKAIKRLRVVDAFNAAGMHPSWMILDVIPVIPPDLRPMVQLDGGRFATSDLNDLYRRVINRNNRLHRLKDMGAPDIIIRNEMRMLQEAVDALIDNGRRGRAVVGPNNRPLKSLSDIIEGKQGRFRQNLLGKRVDYSGRSVIVVGPSLKLHQCGLPKEMALELFKPFVMNKLVERGIVQNIKSAKKKIERGETIVWDILEEVIKGHPVLLNRAPTLHRLGIQAFEPVLVEGRAIQIHPLVCTAFNADFDGDQMAVHVPLSVEAQTEARVLMLASNNVLSPATGRPIITPTQDMVMGCYYLTTEDPNATKGQGMLFKDFAEVLSAYSAGEIQTHTKVLVRYEGARDEAALTPEMLEVIPAERREWAAKKLEEGKLLLTTAGRIILNENLPETFPFFNRIINKKGLEKIVMLAYDTISADSAALLADRLKGLGFRWATKSGVSLAISDLEIPKDKKAILARCEEEIELSRRAYLRGEITEVERYAKVIDTWAEASEELAGKIQTDYDRLNSVYMMAFSGARGNVSQVRQLVAMRGLMADPSGRIIDLPIKSNFREGLNVTEYFISSYGARKGIVDTALRTADSGYLTRRLADVAQDVIVRDEDCGTDRGLRLTSIKEGDNVAVALVDRVNGRVLAENLVDSATGEVLLERNTLITPLNRDLVKQAEPESLFVRSPLTCQSKRGVCRQCYGWSLTNNQLVDIGEAIGIIAAQSIGEPGTQLTMRTFHTGGVFTKSSTAAQIKARHAGTFNVAADAPLRDFRTAHGNVIQITDQDITVEIKATKKTYTITIPEGFDLKFKAGDHVPNGAVLAEAFAEAGRTSRKSLERAYKDISAEAGGLVEFQGFTPEEKRDRQGNVSKTAPRAGVIWVMAGDVFSMPAGANLQVANGTSIKEGDVIAETVVATQHGGEVRLGSDIETEVAEDGRIVIKHGRDVSVVTAELIVTESEVMPGKKDPILRVGPEGSERVYALRVSDEQRVESDTVIAEHVEETHTVPTSGEVRYLEVGVGDRRLLVKPSRLLFIPDERIPVNKDISLLQEGFMTGSVVEAGQEVVKDIKVKNNGVLEIIEGNNIIREVVVFPGDRYEIAMDADLEVADGALIEAGTTLAAGVKATRGGVVKILDMGEDPAEQVVVVRTTQELHVAPQTEEIPYDASTDDIGLAFFTRLLVKDGERIKANSPVAKTEAVLKITGNLAHLAGKVELPDVTAGETGGFRITILESMPLRRELPALAKRADAREPMVVTYLLAENGSQVKSGTPIVRTEILSHDTGKVEFPAGEAGGRLLLVTSEQEVKLTVKGLAVADGAFVQEGLDLGGGVISPVTGKLRVIDKNSVAIRLARPYLISSATQLLTDDGDIVVRGETLATLVYDRVKTGDIIQGLPRVEELLEGRKPKESALIAERGGVVKLLSAPEEATKVYVVYEGGEDEYAIPGGGRLIVEDGETIETGELLTEGPVNPHDVLRILGVEAVQKYLVDEVQVVYRSQGVEIADKHIEVIVRQMTRKMKVDDPGDTTMLPGEMVDSLDVEQLQAEVVEREGTPAVVHPVLLGITKASLNTESFVSAASFQETTRVLTEAAIEGKKDWLHGLKENVVIGRLIPAGTGFFDTQEEEASPITEGMMIGGAETLS